MILIIAFKAQETIREVLHRISKEMWDKAVEVLVIDDASANPDKTFEIALDYKKKNNLGKLSVQKNTYNKGYGGNQKIGFNYAISKGYDIVAVLHGDGQYPPEYLIELVEPLESDNFQMIFGSRIRGKALMGGMPIWKYIGNRFLTFIENLFLGLSLSEYHSGFRAYSCEALQIINLKLTDDGFVFDTDIIIQYKENNLKIGEIVIPTQYDERSHVIHFNLAVIVGFGILKSVFFHFISKNISRIKREKLSKIF